MQRVTDPLAFVGRVLLAFIFVKEGFDAIANYSGVAGYVQSIGVSASLLPLVILVQFGGGLSVLTGFLTRLGAVGLAGFCLLTALLFHRNWADFNEAIQFQKDFCMAGGFLVLAAFGPGAWSIDAVLAARLAGIVDAVALRVWREAPRFGSIEPAERTRPAAASTMTRWPAPARPPCAGARNR